MEFIRKRYIRLHASSLILILILSLSRVCVCVCKRELIVGSTPAYVYWCAVDDRLMILDGAEATTTSSKRFVNKNEPATKTKEKDKGKPTTTLRSPHLGECDTLTNFLIRSIHRGATRPHTHTHTHTHTQLLMAYPSGWWRIATLCRQWRACEGTS